MVNAGQARMELLRAGFGVVVEEADRSEQLPDDAPDRNSTWWASLTSKDSGEIAHKHYGGGTTPDEAVVRAWDRYQRES
ncbi:MAG TPA: hypothetical protein VGA69_03050 [Nitriliruptorales bacterium]